MKDEREDENNQEEEQMQQVQVKEHVRKIEHPEEQYSVNEVFSIRKESSNMANAHIYKKLNKSFQKIKKLRSDPNNNNMLPKEYDYETDPIRITFKRAREIFNLETKTNIIVKKKIDKIRNKVDRIKTEVENSELSFICEVDVNKIYARSNQSVSQGTPNQQKEKFK